MDFSELSEKDKNKQYSKAMFELSVFDARMRDKYGLAVGAIVRPMAILVDANEVPKTELPKSDEKKKKEKLIKPKKKGLVGV